MILMTIKHTFSNPMDQTESNQYEYGPPSTPLIFLATRTFFSRIKCARFLPQLAFIKQTTNYTLFAHRHSTRLLDQKL